MDIFPNFPTLFPQFRETAGFNVGSPLPTFLHGLRSVKSLQTMKWSEVKSLSRVRLFVTPWTFQGIVLEWIAISFSRGSSWSRDWTRVSHIVDRHFTVWATREVAKQETRVQSLDQEDPLEREITTHSIILAWEIPWTEEPGRLQFMGLQKSQAYLSD